MKFLSDVSRGMAAKKKLKNIYIAKQAVLHILVMLFLQVPQAGTEVVPKQIRATLLEQPHAD